MRRTKKESPGKRGLRYEEVASYAHSCGLFAEQILDAADM